MALHITNGPDVFRRNLGSQASSTVTPTETGTTSTTSAPAESTTAGTSSGIFTANSSPPLIVAFLAIGLFLAAMLTIFGWRRMYFNRGLVTMVHPLGGGGDLMSRREAYIGEKPELWDFWTREPVLDNEGLKWRDIMPFSTRVTKQLDQLSPSSNRTHASTRSFSRFFKLEHIRQHLRRHDHLGRPVGSNKTAAKPAETATLQVAVVIAMPSLHRRQLLNGTSSSNVAGAHPPPRDGDRMVYSLGLMEMPWPTEAG